MRVLIDGVRLTNRPAGVIDITISIINSLSLNFPEYEIIVLTHNKLHPDVENQIYRNDNIKVIIEKTIFFQSKGLYWSLFKINSIIKRINPDIFLAPNSLISPFFFPKNIKVVVYIHDLVYLLYPESMSLITKIQMKMFQEYSINRANFFWTNSEYTKNQLNAFFSDKIKNKLIFSGSGINSFFLKEYKKYVFDCDKYPFFDKKYILFVGTQEPRKNILFLLKLFSEIRNKDYHLVIVGSKGWGKLKENINDIIYKDGYPIDKLYFTGYIDKIDLISIYKFASIFISTSFNEGLGLPQLEAMSMGIPVISPNNSAMKEVVSGAGITVVTWDINDWINAINKIEENRDFYIERGYKRILNYNWDKVILKFNRDILLDIVNKDLK